jgi:hypothetical protein
MSKKKKLAIFAALALMAFYLLNSPTKAADAVSGLAAGIVTAAGQLSVFLTNISL